VNWKKKSSRNLNPLKRRVGGVIWKENSRERVRKMSQMRRAPKKKKGKQWVGGGHEEGGVSLSKDDST